MYKFFFVSYKWKAFAAAMWHKKSGRQAWKSLKAAGTIICEAFIQPARTDPYSITPHNTRQQKQWLQLSRQVISTLANEKLAGEQHLTTELGASKMVGEQPHTTELGASKVAGEQISCNALCMCSMDITIHIVDQQRCLTYLQKKHHT